MPDRLLGPAPARPRVAVAMSGGVDSSVAAALLHARGLEVVGVTLKLWDQPAEVDGGCCSATDIDDARRVAAELGFAHYVLDHRDAFAERVVEPFVGASLGGRTPSPCVACNQQVKFDRLLRVAAALGAATLATGHYARLGPSPDGRGPSLRRAADRRRDQSYFLYGLPPEALGSLEFPLGDLAKDEVRAAGRAMGLRVADKPDSQDLCFLQGSDARAFVEARAPEGALRPGEVVDRGGRVLGGHGGVHRFTVGQRRGLGLGGGSPLYVLDVDADSARVTVGPAAGLACASLVAEDFRWLRRPGAGEPLRAQVRSRAEDVPASVEDLPGGRARVRFDAPQTAVAPGQAVVVYSADEVLGGGTIASREAAVA